MKKNQDDIQVENQFDNQDEKSNIGCRLFIEQIELILQMPENERKEFLWALIMNAYSRYKNQNVNQIDNQDEIQIECAYVSVSVSVSDSISVLNKFNKLIFNSMEKTVRFKKFSSNYGGNRKGSGRPAKKDDLPKQQNLDKPTKKEIEDYAHNQLGRNINVDEFISWYDAQGWLDKNGFPINWKQKVQSWIKRDSSTKQVENTQQEEIDYSDFSTYRPY